MLRMSHAKGGHNGVAESHGPAVGGDQAPLATGAPETGSGTAAGGCAAVFRGDSVDSMDGVAVVRAAAAIREQEHRASAVV